MGEKLKFKEAADKLFGTDKKVRLIFIIGIAGILLIFFSSLFGGKGNENAAQGTQSFDSEQYVEKLEERIYTMVTGIQGVGKAKVMITLENTTEYIYESEKRETTDATKDYSDGQTEKEQERNDYERNVILVEGSNGKEALLKTTVEPKVKGVVVVCQGGENIEVEKSIIDAVTTALDISSNKVCVAKLSEN